MDVMIDLETMGNNYNAAIASIGAVCFDPKGEVLPTPGHLDKFEFHEKVDLQSCQQLGLTIDASTVYFWLQQSDAARQAVIVNKEDHGGGNFLDDGVSLPWVLNRFNKWLKEHNPQHIWAWPPTFDLVILRSAYKVIHSKPAWHYTEERCLRTLLDTVTGSPKYPDDFSTPTENIAHNALWDAWRQAKLVQYCNQRLGK